MSKAETITPHAEALALAQDFLGKISLYVERAEIAGSLRRGKPFVHDIEIVVIPKREPLYNMFAQVVGYNSLLDAALCGWVINKGGDHYKQIALLGGINVDLFITTPEQWGVIFAIRTGSADFSHWLVAPRNKGGAMPSYMRVSEGRVWAGSKPYDTPEEADFFRVIEQPYVDPAAREAGRWFNAKPTQESK